MLAEQTPGEGGGLVVDDESLTWLWEADLKRARGSEFSGAPG